MNNEPVAYRWKSDLGYIYDIYDYGNGEPLYTHPSEHDLGIAEAIGFDKGYKAATAKTQEPDCYGDGNVYRGIRSKDSEIQTIHVNSTAKTLTDEEIHKIAQEHFHAGLGINPLDFARAILRKAQEK